MSHVFAYLFRMTFIRRWGLMAPGFATPSQRTL